MISMYHQPNHEFSRLSKEGNGQWMFLITTGTAKRINVILLVIKAALTANHVCMAVLLVHKGCYTTSTHK